MLVLGHVAFTAAAARAVRPGIDLRLAGLLALLPDVVDKPLRALAPELVNRSTRSFGHSLAGAAVALAALLLLRRREGDGAVLWACWALHLVFDRMWLDEGPVILLWPLLGGFPPPVSDPAVMRSLWTYNAVSEALAAVLVVWSIRRRPAAAT